MKEELVALFGGAKPTVRLYHELLKYMPLEERGIFLTVRLVLPCRVGRICQCLTGCFWCV